MTRVTGLGGIFFKCSDPEKIREWYRKHLGIESDQYGATFDWRYKDDPVRRGYSVWSPFSPATKYFSPSEKPFMINYRVENLKELLGELRKEGITVIGDMVEEEFGKFGWILDPDGNKIELWEPPVEQLPK